MSDWKEIEDEVDGVVTPPAVESAPAETPTDPEEPPVEAEAPEGEEAEAEGEAKAEEEGEKPESKDEEKPKDDDRPRDDKGRFIPVDRHEDVLKRQREQANEKLTALQRENEELKERLSKIPAEPTEDDKAFEARIENLPEEVQDILRSQRSQTLELQRKLEDNEKAQQQKEAATKEEREHNDALAGTQLGTYWGDKAMQAALVAISKELIDNPEYEADSRAAHYKDVETEFFNRYPALKPATEAPKAKAADTKPQGKAPAVPSSMSSIRGAITPTNSVAESFATTDPLTLAARAQNMSNEEFERFMAEI